MTSGRRWNSTKRRYVSPLGKTALSPTDMVKCNTKKSLISAEGKKFWELSRVQINYAYNGDGYTAYVYVCSQCMRERGAVENERRQGNVNKDAIK